MSRNDIPISIVICFRDWGLERLRAAVNSHQINASIAGLKIQVVVSDYGSMDHDAIRDALTGVQCEIVRTEAGGPWNRSAALNAGISVATGRWIITTDADIVFTPATMPALLACVEATPDAIYLIQCRDLPAEYDSAKVSSILTPEAWETGIQKALASARIRPRWGMGGFAAFSAKALAEVNGYEERMRVWGGEDNDFALRMCRAGYPVRWLSRPDVGILHIWHEPSQAKALGTSEGEAAIKENRRILREDHSIVRNLPRAVLPRRAGPAVSIVIPTYKRSDLLCQAIWSCIRQTYRDWELLVVENGASDEAKSVVDKFSDRRIRYLKSPKPGAACARNFGIGHSVGRYIVIHDDDDVMVTTRIEDHLAALEGGVHGSFGGWIDFDDETFEPTALQPGKEFSFEAVLCNGRVLTHGSLMLDRRIFNRFRYFESLSAGIDYGFILMLARHGLRLRHTGNYGILRRLHNSNMTHISSSQQKAAAIQMAELVRSEIDDVEYQSLRSRGKAAAPLLCANEQGALQELAALKGAVRNESPLVIDAALVGAGLEDALHRKETLDSMVLEALMYGRDVTFEARHMSTAAEAYARVRLAALRLRVSADLLTDRG